MGNGAQKLVDAMKKVNHSQKSPSSEIVTLTVESTSPLVFSLENRISITSDFYILSKLDKWSDPNVLRVGDVVRAMTFNEGQKYYIMDKEPFEEEFDLRQMEEDIDYLKEIIDPGGGTTWDYNRLANKPQINDIELVGNKSLEDLNVYYLTNIEIDNLLANADAGD